jgi:hypothetical protein
MSLPPIECDGVGIAATFGTTDRSDVPVRPEAGWFR